MNILKYIILCSLVFVNLCFADCNNFSNNPLVPSESKEKIKPFLLSDAHPIKPLIDAIFLDKRVTKDEKTFAKAGFQTIAVTERSFIRVAKHPWVPGYLFKVALDSETRNKRDKPEWHWFLQRCIGAKKIRTIIRDNQFQYFKAPHKWIYPLPLETKPENSHRAVVLIVEDMGIVSKEDSKWAWGHKITRAHLNELFVIIRDGKGSSYRYSNIPYTRSGLFAFIDTEYPNAKPDFERIRHALAPKMAAYWDDLVDRK